MTKDMSDLYTKICKTLLKVILKVLSKWRDTLSLWVEYQYT